MLIVNLNKLINKTMKNLNELYKSIWGDTINDKSESANGAFVNCDEINKKLVDKIKHSKAYRTDLSHNKALNKWFNALKYIGNVLLCAALALVLVMEFVNYILKNAL